MHRHEGSGSILAHLKERGWATSLSAGEGSGSFSARSFFNVRVTLTDEGVRLLLDAMSGQIWQTSHYKPLHRAELCQTHVNVWYAWLNSTHLINACNRVVPAMFIDTSAVIMCAGFDHVQEIANIVFDYIRIVTAEGVTAER